MRLQNGLSVRRREMCSSVVRQDPSSFLLKINSRTMRSKKTVTASAAAALAAVTALQQCPSAHAFQSSPQYQHVPSHAHRISAPLHVVSDPVTSSAADEDVVRSRSPLSMTVDELAVALGGRGRALAAWDMYRIGVDPLTYYDATKENVGVDAAVYQVVAEGAGPQLSELMNMANDDEESTSTKRENIVSLLPAKRRTEGLGKGARELLAGLHSKAASPSIATTGGIEETIGRLSHISTSNDGTTKLLIRMASDGLEVETVIIPWYDREKPRSTLCVSSQVGCAQGCTFCATGRMGRLRSLTSDEILAQVWYAHKVCRVLDIPSVDNIVFMGMGEPADNAEEVVVAAESLADRQRYELAQSRITISTVAPNPKAFATLGKAPAALAWSVHASQDELRKKLVPTTKYSMEELRLGFVEALKARSKKLRTTMLEIALIDGVNDGMEEADHLADFALKICKDVPGAKVVVNLIPYNSIDHPTYRKPTEEAVAAFQKRLMEKGVMVYVRTTRGDDESAACGQLATKKKKKKTNSDK